MNETQKQIILQYQFLKEEYDRQQIQIQEKEKFYQKQIEDLLLKVELQSKIISETNQSKNNLEDEVMQLKAKILENQDKSRANHFQSKISLLVNSMKQSNFQ